MKKSIFMLTMLIGFSAFLLNSCSKSSDSATPAASTTPVAGSWGRTNGSFLYAVTFNNDLSYSVTASGAAVESGTFTVADSTLSLKAITSTSNCGTTVGKYYFNINASVIKFTWVSDSCAVRVATMSGNWNKK
jgi:hypothetical protein